ncbi:MAG: DUF2189 domain-containing protein [Methylotenera sp.]|nr:DUF2189 domain-containing protein [Methylotenera sp.]HPH07101.1 DUF2189 domain-containing protein [Methylotenera sp.]HPM49084.1 DUF2189 domain-containing protein [Methylotenera sp.]
MRKSDRFVNERPAKDFPVIRRVKPSAVADWLHAGVMDTHRGGWASLFYGAALTVTGMFIHVFFAKSYWLLAGLTTGFLLLGPFLAIGLYDLSRRMELNEPPKLIPSLTAWLPNLINVSIFAGLLITVMLIWVGISFSIFSYYFNHNLPTFIDVAINVITFKQPTFALIYFAVGGFFAAFIFAISVVAVPLMLDRKASAVSAALASLRVCVRNPLPMLLWAFCIVVLVGFGFATSFLGLIIAMPIVGHASWHVYRDLIETNDK